MNGLLDATAYWIGYLVMMVGSFGCFFAVFVWAADKAINWLGFNRAIISAYGRILQEKRDRERHTS